MIRYRDLEAARLKEIEMLNSIPTQTLAEFLVTLKKIPDLDQATTLFKVSVSISSIKTETKTEKEKKKEIEPASSSSSSSSSSSASSSSSSSSSSASSSSSIYSHVTDEE